MDRGAWWATFHGTTESRMRLGDQHTHTHTHEFTTVSNHLSCIHAELLQPCLTLCHPMDCSLPDSSVHGISRQEYWSWYASPFSRGSFQPRDQTQVSRIAGRLFTVWATWEVTSVNYFQKLNVNFILEMLPSLKRWWGSHQKQEACSGKHSMCKCVFWNL